MLRRACPEGACGAFNFARFCSIASAGSGAGPDRASTGRERERRMTAETQARVTELYAAKLAAGDISEDPAQAAVVEEFARLELELRQRALARKSSALGWLFQRRAPEVPRGMYVYGKVGRGKTMLMDLFFAALPGRDKRRAHFH